MKKMREQEGIHIPKCDLRLFPLEDLLLPGQALSVNITHMIIALVRTNAGDSNPILVEQPVTETDMRLLLPLLHCPYYCAQETLRASLFCSFPGLLDGLIFPEHPANDEWQITIAEQRLLLLRAQEQNTLKKELKPLYNALSRLRPKLHSCGLEVATSSSYAAYRLISLHFPR